MSKSFGYYAKNGEDFIITTPDIPRNWYNYFWNDNYVSYTSQASMGESLTQDRLGKRHNLVSGRGFFIKEGKRAFSIGGNDPEEKYDLYRCIHKKGATEITTKKFGIEAKVTVFVPRETATELWQIKVKNNSERKREISAIAFATSAFDGAYGRQGYNTECSYYSKDCGAVYIKRSTKLIGKGSTAYGFMAMGGGCDRYSGYQNAIIGPNGSFAHPIVAKNGCVSEAGEDRIAGCGEKLGYATERVMTLMPGEEKSVVVIMGIAFSPDEMRALIEKQANGEFFESELSAVLESFSASASGVKISTPDKMLNSMFGWLKHQTLLGSRWARVRHNGMRDLTSDTDCLSNFNPELALERFLRILTYQDSNGYAPRTFIDGAIKPNNFADNTVWLTMTAHSIIKELGRIDILDTEVPYNDGTVGTVYEHLYRSTEFLYNFTGHHGLIKIWGGDWNDCMNTAGLEGLGVSVWLSIAWVRANNMFAELAELYGKADDAKMARERGEIMKKRIEEFGWDGEYYIDAINDKGVKIGSQECEEGKIFLIPQIWSVFSGVSDIGRETLAMDAVEKYLSDPLGTVISYPPYTKWDGGIGAVTTKHAGIHENGGVYLHTIAWKIAADAMLGRADLVERDIETILPFRNKVVDGRAEPYVMCNSYFGKQTGYRYGTPGQSWRTAAGQWFEKSLVNYVFGLMPEMEGLSVKPCLPPSWKNASIEKVFRGFKYSIRIKNGGTKVKYIKVNGKKIKGNILPLCDAEVLVVTE